jgi:predicted ATPase
LFIERARATDPTFELTAANTASVAELCNYLGGLPLALELAAARAAVLSPAAILERLRTSSEPLGPGRRDAPERHRTLHATIDWTYQLLTPAEQTLFAQLGLFVGGFTAHSAEAVCAGVSHSVVDGLASLLDHSLIHPVTTPRDRRLAMLEPIRDYALSRLLQDAGHEHAIVRHAAHYVAVAEAAQAGLKSSDQLQWLDALDDEQANLRAVLQHANSQPQLDLALQIAGALRDYWVTRDLVPEIRAWFFQALAKPPGADATRVLALLVLGVAACEDAAWTVMSVEVV